MPLNWCFVSQINHSYRRGRQLRQWLWRPSVKKQKTLSMIKGTWIPLKTSAPQVGPWGHLPAHQLWWRAQERRMSSNRIHFSEHSINDRHSCPPMVLADELTHTHLLTYTYVNTYTFEWHTPRLWCITRKDVKPLPCSQAGHCVFIAVEAGLKGVTSTQGCKILSKSL